MSEENRIKQLYQKYIDRTCSDAELEELFDLLKQRDQFFPVRAVLRKNWDDGKWLEELSTLDWNTFLERTGQNANPRIQHNTRKRKWMVPVSMAAGFLLILGMATWFWMHREVIIMYETGYGEVREIVLSDSSHVRLNANSKMYWDENWKNRGDRNVRIEGEAFFDVAYRDGNAFFVETNDLTVHVTGTTFNVNHRRGETEVFLESGKISLQLHPGVDKAISESGQSVATDRTLELIPGDQLKYSSATQEMKQLDNQTIEQAASWKIGELIYKNKPFKEVLLELSDIYGKNFVVQDSSLFEKKVDVGLPYSDWETVKKLMKFTIKAEIVDSENEVIIK